MAQPSFSSLAPVWIHRGRMYWQNRPAAAAAHDSEGLSALARLRNNLALITVALYFLFNWGFQQVRIPPQGVSGLPTAEVVLLLFLLTIHLPNTLARLGQRVYLLPFAIWWAYGLGRAVVDATGAGFWALRDAAHVIESLFLLVGFTFAAQPAMLEKFFKWLPRLLFFGACYGLFYPISGIFEAISPQITAANGYPTPIIGTMANSPFVIIMAAFYLLLFHGRTLPAVVVAMALIGYTLAVFQARTLYLVMIALFGFLVFFRRSSFGNVALLVGLAVFGLAVISLVGLQVEGRLGASLSAGFLVDHFLAIFGICNSDQPGVCSAAAGVDQRLGWWQHIFNQMLADPFKLLLGLGYGVVLTDHAGLSGAVTREPHNSYITILARTGLIGITCWLAMMISLVRSWYLTFRRCHELDWRLGENRLMVLMVFFICMWVLAIGEDGFEKPYNIVPFYFFWGIVLRFSLLLARGEIGPDLAEPSRSPPAADRLEIPSRHDAAPQDP